MHDVPSRLPMNGTASSRKISMPRLASQRIVSSTAANTRGLSQLRSHWYGKNVVHTHACASSAPSVKEPGAWSGKTSLTVASYASGIVRSG